MVLPDQEGVPWLVHIMGGRVPGQVRGRRCLLRRWVPAVAESGGLGSWSNRVAVCRNEGWT